MGNAIKTAHKHDCQMAFGRKDPTCPRCQELLAGAPSRDAGWGRYKARKAQEAAHDAMRLVKIREHYKNGKCNCGPVCTKFEW